MQQQQSFPEGNAPVGGYVGSETSGELQNNGEVGVNAATSEKENTFNIS